MSLALPLLIGLGLSLLLGGSLRRLADLRLRSVWIFYAAIAMQVVAFPVESLPWRTPDDVAKALWLASDALIAVAAARNLRIPGVPLVAAGLVSNLAAVLSNGGHMPVRAAAMRAAGYDYSVHNNSAALASPHLSWLIDRWAAPGWIPFANVFSVGDVLIALGGFVFAVAATGAVASLRARVGRPGTIPA
ncbi:MAG TPA: DUF5317 domain-containing protein [Gaiellaceae bacterium]|jgi:hypothetical protein